MIIKTFEFFVSEGDTYAIRTLTFTVKEKYIHYKCYTTDTGNTSTAFATAVVINDRFIRISPIKVFMQYKARLVWAKDEQYIHIIY